MRRNQNLEWLSCRSSTGRHQALRISEAEVVRNVMLKDTVDGAFTTIQDVSETAVFFAVILPSALTGQSSVVSHGWFMQ